MNRLLVLNMAMEAGRREFIVRWVEELARRIERVDVITNRRGQIPVPANVHVHSLGREEGASRALRLVRFYRYLWQILHDPDGPRVQVCFAHMIPSFALAAAPVLAVHRVPLVLWYAHPAVTWKLRLAHGLATRVVTSLPGTFPLASDKVAAIGQGIDIDLFSPDEGTLSPDEGMVSAAPGRILCVGRLSRIKDQETLIRAIGKLRARTEGRLPRSVGAAGLTLEFVGEPAVPADRDYVEELRELVAALGLDDVVRFVPTVSMSELPDLYRRCTVHVNATRPGSGDKVALEAMACGRPSLVANRAFVETLGKYAGLLVFEYGDPDDLTGKLARVLRLTEAERREMGRCLRDRVVRMHGLERLADRLLETFESVQRSASRRGSGPAASGADDVS